MCARYRLTNSPSQIARHLGLLDANLVPIFLNSPVNIAISQMVPVVRNHDGSRMLTTAEWGFRAPWDKVRRIFNAKAETAAEKPVFRTAFHHGRCLMPANGFYEWPNKQATLISFADDRLFCFAGLMSGNEVTMLTCAPNDFMRPIHHRMPVILHPDHYTRWLGSSASMEELTSIIRPRPWIDMVAAPAG